MDGYHCATIHYIEERSEGSWELKNDLAGFTRLNSAHNGKRLGQALFKMADRLGIAGRVCSFLSYSLSVPLTRPS